MTVVGSAADAFKALRTSVPDIIVSDLSMPQVDGFELLRRLREDSPEPLRSIPALALTALASEGIRQRALASGYQSYLVKPYDLDALATLISELVQQRSWTEAAMRAPPPEPD